MSRILLAWELGRHLGHVSRLLPLATRLKAHGHSVLAVVRDIPSASAMFDSAGLSFIQSPWHTGVPTVAGGMTGYADLLLSQGWSDRSTLWGLLQAWITLYRLFQPDVVVLDYAPTASLAAKVLKIPAVLIGTGFELPPAKTPLPPFPGFPGATQAATAASEQRVLENVNAVLHACHAESLPALCSLIEGHSRFLTTFPELDHYGSREGEHYIGPLSDPLYGRRIEWPSSGHQRVFAYLRPNVPELPKILEGLAAADASVVAYVPGMPAESLIRFNTPQCIFSAEPVQTTSLFEQADVCLSYAPAGTVTTALLHAIPQLMIPLHMESQLTAQRVASQGLGKILHGPQSSEQVAQALQELLSDHDTRLRARAFAERHRGSSATAADIVVQAIESLCRGTGTEAASHVLVTVADKLR